MGLYFQNQRIYKNMQISLTLWIKRKIQTVAIEGKKVTGGKSAIKD